MEFVLQLIILFTFWLPFLTGAIFFVALLIVYYFKALDYEDKYLKTLDEETLLLYNKIKLNKRMPFGKVFEKKEVSDNEDK